MGWSGVVGLERVMQVGVKMLSWDWDWAIVCGVCYYRNLLQMQHFHPNPRPRLVITNSADNTRYRRNMALYHIENNEK